MSKARHKREAGGRTSEDSRSSMWDRTTDERKRATWAGGNPEVKEEAQEDEPKAKKKRGGSIHEARTKHHLGKRGRATGGRIGADRSPLSSAHTSSGGHGRTSAGGKVRAPD